MTIRRLTLPYQVPPQIRCEALVEPPTHDDSYRLRRFPDRPEQCRRMSGIEIDGHKYCRLHAGRIALGRWLDGKLREIEDDVKIHE